MIVKQGVAKAVVSAMDAQEDNEIDVCVCFFEFHLFADSSRLIAIARC